MTRYDQIQKRIQELKALDHEFPHMHAYAESDGPNLEWLCEQLKTLRILLHTGKKRQLIAFFNKMLYDEFNN